MPMSTTELTEHIRNMSAEDLCRFAKNVSMTKDLQIINNVKEIMISLERYEGIQYLEE